MNERVDRARDARYKVSETTTMCVKFRGPSATFGIQTCQHFSQFGKSADSLVLRLNVHVMFTYNYKSTS